MLNYDWIVFDSTGTLMTPTPEPAEIYRSVGAQYGSALGVDEIRVALRAAMVKHFMGDQALLATNAEFELGRWRRIVTDTLTDLDDASLEVAFDTLWSIFANHDQWRLFDDVRDTIERLKQRGYKIAIASNFDERLQNILRGMAIESLFDEVLISSQIGWSKPNPNFYATATERLGVSDRSRILMIGDTYVGDVAAPASAGWHSRHLVRQRDDALAELLSDL